LLQQRVVNPSGSGLGNCRRRHTVRHECFADSLNVSLYGWQPFCGREPRKPQDS
jgi:hypothetical protein